MNAVLKSLGVGSVEALLKAVVYLVICFWENLKDHWLISQLFSHKESTHSLKFILI